MCLTKWEEDVDGTESELGAGVLCWRAGRSKAKSYDVMQVERRLSVRRAKRRREEDEEE